MVGIHDGQALQDAAGRVVRLMMQEGLDLSTTGRRQLTASMLTNADLVVVMAHRETWPEYLHENRNVVCWDVEDPHGMPDNFLIDVKEQIREKVVELVRSIG